MKRDFLFLCVLVISSANLFAQNIINGFITDSLNSPIANVNVFVKGSQKGTITNVAGEFQLELDSIETQIVFQHISYYTLEFTIAGNDTKPLHVVLQKRTHLLDAVDVSGISESKREQPSVIIIQPKSVESLPSPFGEFSKVLSTLPGVVSNNELSSSYAVRGGNFDENLVYVNDIPIYRPQLITAGRQEGLSFVNSKLANSISFSAGGWQPKYGDKLSSSLNVTYKEPEKFGASATIGLLGADVHLENATRNNRSNYIMGVRHKRSEYLLNSLETKGEYRPRFTDIQSYTNFNLGPKSDLSKTKIGVLLGYSRNRYTVTPQSKQTEFGTFNQALRLYVAFIGSELVQYDTYQGGIKLSHRFNDRIKSHLIVSGVNSKEKEYRDVEGAYRLCDVDNRPGSNSFNECVVTRGIGSNYQHSRNSLDTKLLNIESRNEIKLNNSNQLEVGLGYGLQQMDDILDEYTFRDSSEFVINLNNINALNYLNYSYFTSYIQNTTTFSSNVWLSGGVRLYYTDRNKDILLSPRLQVGFEPKGIDKDIVFRAAVGVYQQPAFYRELRDLDGNLHNEVEAQSSTHFILGMDQNMQLWGRGFKLSSEVYYKYYMNIIPYDVDNVRLRYYADTKATGYATGLDVRFSGEFVPGTVSWFSLGVISTKEDVVGDNKGLVRRPSDQRVNLGIHFQDQLPNDPSWRVNLSLLMGTGLPFGPPGDINNRNIYTGNIYRRVDIGFVKELFLGSKRQYNLLLGADILNMLGTDNTISHTWIEDVVGQEYAIPNSLSARFLNLKLSVKI